MTAPMVTTLIEEQVSELPEALAMPADRVLMLFKGPTFAAAVNEAALASIENPAAWKCRACICGEWTVGYEVRA
ncbi:hypothetical protein [Pseudomonas putida]|uniref:Uncharacterized protein n=1 Tax=Pseudomonas putida (strain DOT-T1E) TaxID=1196325 RepID=I7B782_PSEPT|nr:hypothetical protein [Pseudomonas putida]AFO47188.1 hypothetical protein T1E_1333 [Pseudomonas putida DOT-T1E]UZM95147.1 hypothetical protein OPZ46_06925 [Pseudomonas putida DOT-T1E]